MVFEDDDAVAYTFGNTIVNLLKTTAAPELIEPATVASREAGSRLVLTIDVHDVDAVCAELASRGAELLNGPIGPAVGCENRQLQRSRRPHLGGRPRALPGRRPVGRRANSGSRTRRHP